MEATRVFANSGMLFTTTFGSLTREHSSLPAVRTGFDFPRADEGGVILGMSENYRTQKQYDHRLRLLIQNTRDLDLAVRHGVLRSTARGWLWQSKTDVVSIRLLDGSKACLHAVIDHLSRRGFAGRVNDSFIPAVTARLLIGSGFDPGVTNVFCTDAAKHLFDEIETIDIVDCSGLQCHDQGSLWIPICFLRW